jgi:hypothetical protein
MKNSTFIVIGVLGGTYALIAMIQFIKVIASSNTSSAYGQANIAAHIVPICLGLAIFLVCLKPAFQKHKK